MSQELFEDWQVPFFRGNNEGTEFVLCDLRSFREQGGHGFGRAPLSGVYDWDKTVAQRAIEQPLIRSQGLPNEFRRVLFNGALEEF